MTEKFDFEKALADLKAGKPITGKDSVLGPLVKQLTEAALEAEIDTHLAQEVAPNRKNGKSRKTMKSSSGEFELETPRDRTGTFEPKLVKKHQTHVSDEIETKILSMYGRGLRYRDISGHVEELYGITVSTATLSAITDKIISEVKEWQQRPLDSHYPFVWMDAIHYKLRENGRYVSTAVYTILGLNMEGKKEVLGLYLSESEGANFWLSVLTDLSNRGVKDILIASVDGLTGFPDAINTIFPDTEVQLCVVHQVRNSLRYVASKHQKMFMVDLKRVYRAVSREAAEQALDELEDRWGQKYPIVLKSWRTKWDNLAV
jgi:transposase-like protein